MWGILEMELIACGDEESEKIVVIEIASFAYKVNC